MGWEKCRDVTTVKEFERFVPMWGEYVKTERQVTEEVCAKFDERPVDEETARKALDEKVAQYRKVVKEVIELGDVKPIRETQSFWQAFLRAVVHGSVACLDRLPAVNCK